LREEAGLDALNAELVGVARETIQPADVLRLRWAAEGESNPMDELGEQMIAHHFRCFSE
jgi:hypothetical protein